MSGPGSLWWRWSWRDLRHHWGAVLAIGAVIAIGTGVFAGLGSTAAWRRMSNDASFAALRLHDLRVELSPGTFAPEGSLRDLVVRLPSTADVADVAERLIVDSQVEVTAEEDDRIVVAARLVGSDFARDDAIDDVWVSSGRLADDGTSFVLERKFAEYYGLEAVGEVEISGGVEVRYTGLGVAPEEFFVSGPEGSVLAHADLATMYAGRSTVQRLTDHAGDVNDLVISLVDGADRERIESELEAAIDETGTLSATVTTQDEVDAFRVLYDDIENDQQIWNALSALVLGAAALAAFNLISRIVEAQRREIGIGMALGAPRHRLALRPMLTGLQIGVLGTLAGIGVGVLTGSLMQGLLRSLVPMPQWRMPFQFDVFAQAAALGLLPPLAAAVLPVWRAVRVEPVEAIRTGHLAGGVGRRTTWIRRVRVIGRSSISQMPLRNLLRAPRRTVLTALGIGAAITALVAVLGMLDSFDRSIQRGTDEVTKGDPDRLVVMLDTFYPSDAAVVAEIVGTEAIGATQATLRLPGTAAVGAAEIALGLEVLELDGGLWSPTVSTMPDLDPTSGVVLAEKAAADLGVGIGDTVALTHPARTEGGFTMQRTELVVSGTHPNPIRNFAFLDAAAVADEFGLAGWTNAIHVTPSDSATRSDVQRAVAGIPGVASAQPVARVGEAFEEAMQQFVGFLVITAAAVLVLALLIAFNSARISVEERRREHATMLPFGVPVRCVVGVVIREAVAVGLLAVAVGLVAGRGVVGWILGSLASRTLPDFQIDATLSITTMVAALAVGVLSVTLAPLLLVRRIGRMNLPDTLRVME